MNRDNAARELADVERQRLRALVEGVAAGEINYLHWEPEAIDARVRADAGCVRYRSTIEIVVEGRALPAGRYWHTDYYERRDGRWQVVWSQATATA